MGHAESAAGIAGLTKILLQLKHGRLVPSLHSQHLNPNIDFAATPFRVQQRLDDWQRDEGPRIAGLSSFGAGGSNAHFVVAEYVDEVQNRQAPGPAIYPFSARDACRLEVLVARFRAALDNLEETQLPSAAYVLQEGREAFEERLAIVAEGKADLAARLDRVLAGETDAAGVYRGTSARERAAPDHTLPLEILAGEWVRGARIDWPELRPGPKPRPVSLPTYPFAEDYCWLPELEMLAEHAARPQAPLPMLFAPLWQEQPDPGSEPAAASFRTVVLCGDLAKDRELADALRDTGAEVVQLDGSSGPIDKRYEFHASKLLDLLKKPGVQRAQNRVLQVVVPGDGGDGLLEGLGGMLRCAALEQSKLSCQLIAVKGTREALAGNLTADAAHARDREMIRYCDGRRHVRRWRDLDPAVPAGWSPWKEKRCLSSDRRGRGDWPQCGAAYCGNRQSSAALADRPLPHDG
ncbi:ketoacyl-synthetase C-terminal extension domain-containing protein [Roseibium salinum]|nr:ketoacyl-synthetase C-terminal extension domain-containing protein [Roseibium salinum]